MFIYSLTLICTFLLFRYRLAPAHHFPVPYEDVYRVVKHFLQKGVLAQFSVDPGRIAVAGDSAGGNLAAAVSQQVLNLFFLSTTSFIFVVHIWEKNCTNKWHETRLMSQFKMIVLIHTLNYKKVLCWV